MAETDYSVLTTVVTEGGLLPLDLLQRIGTGSGDLPGLDPKDYHLDGLKLNEAISRSWNFLAAHWKNFSSPGDRRFRAGHGRLTHPREVAVAPLSGARIRPALRRPLGRDRRSKLSDLPPLERCSDSPGRLSYRSRPPHPRRRRSGENEPSRPRSGLPESVRCGPLGFSSRTAYASGSSVIALSLTRQAFVGVRCRSADGGGGLLRLCPSLAPLP